VHRTHFKQPSGGFSSLEPSKRNDARDQNEDLKPLNHKQSAVIPVTVTNMNQVSYKVIPFKPSILKLSTDNLVDE